MQFLPGAPRMRIKNQIFDLYLRFFIKVLELLKIVEWTSNIDLQNIEGLQFVVVDEARRRNLKIENLLKKGTHTRFFRIKKEKKYYYFESLPIGDSYNRVSSEAVSNKWFVKRVLQKAGLPTPDGKSISSFREAMDYIEKKGFPVVIKPLNESKCIGVTVNIKNEKELKEAIDYVREYGKNFLIEEFLPGKNFRLTVVDGVLVAACLRKHPRVIGDGKHTVNELIKIKNKDERRGLSKNSTLRPITIDNFTREILREQRESLSSVPLKGKTIVLNKRINLGVGADTYDVTETVHREIIQLSIRVALLVEAKLLGLDILARDISKPISRENPVFVIEVNPYPFIDMHHYPYEGKPRNVAGAILDMLFK